MSEPKKVDRRTFLYAGLGAVALIAIGAAAYFATRPPEVITVTQSTTVATTIPTTSVITTTVPTTSVVTTTQTISPSTSKVVFWYGGPWIAAEQAVILSLIRDFEEKTGIKVELTFTPHLELYPKFVAAMEAKQGPDIIWLHQPFVTLYSWRGALVEISDVIDPVKDDFYPLALEAMKQYNNVEKKWGYYGIPLGWASNFCHVRTDLLEQAGFDWKTISNLSWDEFWNAMKKTQQVTGVPAVGLSVSSTAGMGDPFDNLDTFISIFGGSVLTEDRKLNLDDPQTKKAMIDATKFLTDLYFGGWMPSGVDTWGDADNNAAFQTGKCVMTLNPTMSIPMWMTLNRIDLYREKTATIPYPPSPTGERRSPPIEWRMYGVIKPEYSANKNAEGAKKLMAFLLTNKDNYKSYITGFGYLLPNYKSFEEMKGVKWTDPNDRHYPQALQYMKMNPKVNPFVVVPPYAQVRQENVWGGILGKVIVDKWKIEDAVAWGIDRAKAIFEQFKG
jgi:multiple sugar transport system substrate-binding protein